MSTAPCSLFDQVTRAESALPTGVTLTTGREANLFPAGTKPSLTLTSPTAGATAFWTARDRTRVLLSNTALVTAGQQALDLPAALPGLYQVELIISTSGVPVGSSCLRYGVSMPGARLDPSQLPAGKDWGGGGPERDVVMHDMLGVGVVRRGVNFGQELVEPGYARAGLVAAAAQAQARGVALVVQIGQGGDAERTAIANGTWETKVRQIVTTYRGVVPYWEAWNEPNFTYFYPYSSGTDFARRTSIPFYRAVKAADPAAKVVAGSAYGADVAWYTAFAKAGGFRYLDVLSVHPYCWQCGPEGQVTGLRQLAALRNTYAPGKPMWDTESGFKSVTDWGGPWQQADWTVRKFVWQRTLGMRTNQFLLEGGWEDWSVIDTFRGVKPAAMALSAYDTILRGRAFQGWTTAPTGVYAARFGPKPGGTDTVTVVWTNGRSRVWLPLKTRHTTYDQMGVQSSVASRVLVDGSVRYLVSSPGQAL